MNNRIACLYEQAIEVENNGDYVAGEFNPVKFAELIVRECADVAKETRWAVPPSQEQIAKCIQQHFGVER